MVSQTGCCSAPKRHSIHSFDVFDTLVTRAVGTPRDVFHLLGGELEGLGLMEGVSASMFASARLAADRRAHRNWGGRETGVTLSDIWSELCHALGLSSDLVDEFVECELGVERTLLRAVPEMCRALERARAVGPVALLSDTYLTGTQLRSLLAHVGIDAAEAEMFTSCDFRASKGTGRLYEVAAHQLGAVATDLAHVGDDLAADVQGAAKAGAAGRLVPGARPTRYEHALSVSTATTDGASALLAGASRLARLSGSAADPRERVVVEVAAGVAAPLLLSYVQWVLNQARELGVDRIYFLARDGQILHSISQRIGPVLGWGADQLRYLHCSRPSIVGPLLTEEPRRFRSWIWTGMRGASANDVFARAGVEADPFANQLEELGLEDLSRRLSDQEIEQLVARLTEEPVANELASQAEHPRRLAAGYLEQEGFLDEGKVAVVDLGGRGSQFQALALARQRADLEPPMGLYAYLISAPSEPLHPANERAWLFDARRRVGFERFSGLVSMLETFCAADHGSVVGYELDGGSIRPVHGRSGSMRTWGRGIVRETVARAADEWARLLPLSPQLLDLRPAVLECAQLFWTDPSQEEVMVWGQFAFEDGQELHPLATPASLREAAGFVAGRGWAGKWFAWPTASIALGPPWVRWMRRLVLTQASSPLAQGFGRTARAVLRRIPRLRVRWRS